MKLAGPWSYLSIEVRAEDGDYDTVGTVKQSMLLWVSCISGSGKCIYSADEAEHGDFFYFFMLTLTLKVKVNQHAER